VEDSELSIFGWLDIKFDDIGVKLKGRLHRGNGVLKVRMSWRKHTSSGTGLVGQTHRGVCLREPSIGEQKWFPVALFDEEWTIIQKKKSHEEDEAAQKDADHAFLFRPSLFCKNGVFHKMLQSFFPMCP
jgi:hypothetical protein